jgi:hypothetical protein
MIRTVPPVFGGLPHRIGHPQALAQLLEDIGPFVFSPVRNLRT